ncbi:6-phosphogluconate dehydrogenase [Xylona heveae TC161]|uniref:6-phosphogluconate dehydrogenase n=1 Tax=Xylona heveae (strain CBS 132557 / TC161) TaxID=1328760 RepID=A0A165A9V4_XYLHT|nr:6-phosphogluconate dehydrogenase [Xylona heveae TC161]KZF20145.1 6-phosphogluconate dehydrogenase [Xylona heveae TC161]
MTVAAATFPRLGWIGLGAMGLGMAKNLQRHLTSTGAPALIFTNRTLSRGKDLEALGAKPANTVAEVVQSSDIVISMLSNDQVLHSVTDEVLAAGDFSGKILMDCTTVGPDTSVEIGEKVSKANGQFIAAPVFGASPVADAGKLIFTVAGPKDALAKVEPYIVGVMGRLSIPMGEDVSKSSLLKIAGNILVVGFQEIIGETQVFAEKTGLGVEVIENLIGDNFGPTLLSYSKRLTGGVYAPPRESRPGFGVDLSMKDARHAIRLGSEEGVKMPALEVALKNSERAKEYADQDGGRPLDSSSMYGTLRRDAGLDFDTNFVKQRDAAK